MKKFKYFIFLISLTFLFGVNKVSAANTGSWITDYCTYTLTDDDTYGKVININSCNFSSANDVTNIIIPSTINVNDVNYKVNVNGQLFKGNNTHIKSVIFKSGSMLSKGERLFEANTTVESIVFEKNIITDNLTSLLRAFTNCNKLSTLDFGNLDTSRVTNFGSMLQSMPSIKKLDLSALNNSSATNMESFINDNAPREIILGKYFNFHVDDETKGVAFSRGTWKRLEDGKEFSALEISKRTATEDMSGTYKRISTISYEIAPKYLTTFSIKAIKPFTIKSSSSSKFAIGYNENEKRNILYVKLDKGANGFSIANDEYVTILFPDAVSDKDGNLYDYEITVNNILLNNSVKSSYDEAYFEIMLYSQNDHIIEFYNSSYDSADIYSGGTATAIIEPTGTTKYDVEFKVVDKSGNPVEGSYLFSAYDIDIPAYGLTENPSLITPDYGYGDDSEGINLYKGGFDLDTLLVSKTATALKIVRNYSNSILARIYGSQPDPMSENSEFVIKANSSSAKVQFTFGRNAGITVMSYYQPKVVRIENTNTKGDKLIGSHFILKDDEGKTLQEWDTISEPVSFFLNPGKYTITQISVKDGYVLAKDTEFFVDVMDKLIVNGEEQKSDLIVVINDKSGSEPVIEAGTCKAEKISGKWHYYDTKGSEISKDEWANKCTEPVPTGSFLPVVAIILGITIAAISFGATKNKNILRNI
ncbi:MAG: DUF285 domain-containing protein [Bacilli bacterium]|nr:DUF285 domain-containing protein [Bacilli bacterium]